jgi:hypothetical protein
VDFGLVLPRPIESTASIRMATEAAWLNGNKLTERRKSKCALTSTGLLMEGAIARSHGEEEFYNQLLLFESAQRFSDAFTSPTNGKMV